MSQEIVEKVMRKLAEECVDRSHFVTSADFRRAERIEIETGGGAVIFRSPVHFKRVAIAESPYGLRLYADVPESDLRFLLPGNVSLWHFFFCEGVSIIAPFISLTMSAG